MPELGIFLPIIMLLKVIVNIIPTLSDTVNFSTKYFILSKIYSYEGGIKYHSLSACTGNNPLAKAHELSPCTGRQDVV